MKTAIIPGQFNIFGDEILSTGTIRGDVELILASDPVKEHRDVMLEYMQLRFPQLHKAVSSQEHAFSQFAELLRVSPQIERACRSYRESRHV